jgi:uncharacterized protein YjeT (DUF2065 family)
MPAPTYRERLRIEGLTLAAAGVVGSAGLLAFKTEHATRWPLNTLGQLAVAAGLLGFFGPRSVRRSIEGSTELRRGEEGSGEPTPLWQLPVIAAGLAGTFVALEAVNDKAGWDAALRITGGCTLVGLAQAVLLERLVAADEEERGRSYLRVKGSRLGRGTKLGWLPRG